MNILIIIPNDILGGAEQYLKMIATEYLKNGNSLYVFFFKKKHTDAWESLSLQFKELSLFYTNSISEKNGFPKLIKNILRNRNIHYDYAFTSHVHCTALTGILCKLRLIKVNHFIGRESTSIFKRFSGLKLKIFKAQYGLGYSRVDLLICQTEYMKDQLIDALPWLNKKTKVRIIPNPVDSNSMIQQSNELNLFSLKKPYIVSAGRLIPEKGFDVLIKAFKNVSDERKDLNLVILGEGQERSALEQLIWDLKLQDKIFLLGFTPNVYPVFKDAELCVVSSRIEGFPNVLLQMMSQNSKVVSTKCAGGIEDIKGVFTCNPDNIDDLYKAVSLCLNTNTESYRDLFHTELKKRDISGFVNTIEKYLNE